MLHAFGMVFFFTQALGECTAGDFGVQAEL